MIRIKCNILLSLIVVLCPILAHGDRYSRMGMFSGGQSATQNKVRDPTPTVTPTNATQNYNSSSVTSAAEFLQRRPESPVIMDCLVKLSKDERSEGSYVLELRDLNNEDFGYGIIPTTNSFAAGAWPTLKDGKEHKAKVLLSYKRPELIPGTISKYANKAYKYSETHFVIHKIKIAP